MARKADVLVKLRVEVPLETDKIVQQACTHIAPPKAPFNFQTLSCREIPVHPSVDSSFFKFAVENQKALARISLFEILPANAGASLPITDRAILAPQFTQGVAFIEANRPLSTINKESLSTLLDLAAEANCSIVLACVRKDDPKMKEILHSFRSGAGFDLVEPDEFIQMPGYILLGLNID